MRRGARFDALAAGEPRYFTSEPCARGHIAERYTCNFKCVECAREDLRKRYAADLPKWRAVSRAGFHRNKAQRYAYKKRRYAEDPAIRCAELCRGLVRRLVTLKTYRKHARTQAVLGYSVQEFRAHIESLWTSGMSWDNHGAWHIDHVTPVAVLLRRGERDPARINALANLQPLWADANRAKGASEMLA